MDTLTVERIDPVKGCGIAHDPAGNTVAVPFTARGDILRVSDGVATLHRAASEERVPPPCPHFGDCGGCQLQHIDASALAEWKRAIVSDALGRNGIDCPVEATQTVPAAARRRARFTLQRTKKTAPFGFRAAGEHRVVDMQTCTILSPAIMAALPGLKAIALAGAPRKRAVTLQVTQTDTGLDVVAEDMKELDLSLRETLAGLVARADLARLVWNGEVFAEPRPPELTFGRAVMRPPPGAFLQAARETETLILDILHDALGTVRRVADLFSGCGTFSLPMAGHAAVTAIDSDPALTGALDSAARGCPALHPVSVHTRDLFSHPLQRDELAPFDAVIIDPPRAGAQAQAAHLADSAVPIVAMISCNPATFARDARTLSDGGYRPQRVIPIDQFRWSPHTEVVGIFRRP